MLQHPLASPDWLLVRLAIVVIDVAAVALIVVLARQIRRWLQRVTTSTAKSSAVAWAARHNTRAGHLLSAQKSLATQAHRAVR